MPVTIDGTTGITTPAENTSALTVGAITGILKATSGVVSQAVAGTDYLVGGGSAITSTNTAKAWVNFNGTLASPITPRAQYNVSSVTKNGTGDYTVNFATPMADANYSICGTASGSAFNGFVGPYPGIAPITTSVRVATQIYTNAQTDQSQVSIAIFGN